MEKLVKTPLAASLRLPKSEIKIKAAVLAL
jgi:hypothetical protein